MKIITQITIRKIWLHFANTTLTKFTKIIFAKFISCTLKKIYLLLESNVLFKPWRILKFLFRNSRNQKNFDNFSEKFFCQNKFKNNLKDFVTKKYNTYTSQEFIKILLVKNLLFTLYENIFICWMWYILRVFLNLIVLFVKILQFSIDFINK